MKICTKRDSVPFAEVSAGEVFIDAELVFMKIEPLTLDDGTIINAISLTGGCPYSFDESALEDDVQVVPNAVLKLYNDD